MTACWCSLTITPATKDGRRWPRPSWARGSPLSIRSPSRRRCRSGTPKSQAKEPIQLDIIIVCRKQKATQSRRPSVVQATESARNKLGRLHSAGFALSRNDRKIVLFGQLLTTLRTSKDLATLAAHANSELEVPEPEQPPIQSHGQLLLFER